MDKKLEKTEKKEKRCLFCRKLLLDEKVPCCLRCMLRGRNYVGTGTATLCTLGVAATKRSVVSNLKSK